MPRVLPPRPQRGRKMLAPSFRQEPERSQVFSFIIIALSIISVLPAFVNCYLPIVAIYLFILNLYIDLLCNLCVAGSAVKARTRGSRITLGRVT